jgi:outer membrane protein OmpA-like peptidoglycan-associated protein
LVTKSCGNAQETNDSLTKVEFKVYGNCGMCEKTIEGSLNGQDGIGNADWDRETKMITVNYNPEKLNENKIKTNNFIKGNVIYLPSVRFQDGTYVFLFGSTEILEEMVVLLKKHSSIKVEIAGHVCCVNNMELSKYRAKKVYDFLIENGINKHRLTYKGYSNTKPKYADIKDARNRRVELRVQ